MPLVLPQTDAARQIAPVAERAGRARPGRRPRVLLVVTLSELGGAQSYVDRLAAVLAGGHEVTVAAQGSGPLKARVEHAGARYVALRRLGRPVDPLRDALALAELLRLIRRVRPDVVHANSSKAGVLARLAAALARVPVRVLTVHGWAFCAASFPASAAYRLAERLLAPLTTLTICVSERERAAGVRARTCRPERSIVIRNAVALPPDPRGAGGSACPRILFVGRLRAPKDPCTLLRALAMLPGGWRATFVGDGPERGAVEAERDRLGLASVVELAGAQPDVAPWLRASDVFVLASRSEGLPMAILEAMAEGLPVVASAVGGVGEAVADTETGLLVPPGNPAALAAALHALLADPGLRGRLGRAGRERVAAEFGMGAFRDLHLRAYGEALSVSGARAPA